MDIGTILYERRNAKGLSQEELAFKVGVSRQSIYKWENNISIPNIYNFTDMNRAIWEVKPAHLAHEVNLNNSRKLNIKTKYEDAKFKYIPCNTIYAVQLQPNTYIKDSELLNLNYVINSEVVNSSRLVVAVLGNAILGIE